MDLKPLSPLASLVYDRAAPCAAPGRDEVRPKDPDRGAVKAVRRRDADRFVAGMGAGDRPAAFVRLPDDHRTAPRRDATGPGAAWIR